VVHARGIYLTTRKEAEFLPAVVPVEEHEGGIQVTNQRQIVVLAAVADEEVA
jgi:hypothetical protein